MINLTLKDYRNHTHSRIAIGGLTLLTGINSTGKSATLEALKLICQSLEVQGIWGVEWDDTLVSVHPSDVVRDTTDPYPMLTIEDELGKLTYDLSEGACEASGHTDNLVSLLLNVLTNFERLSLFGLTEGSQEWLIGKTKGIVPLAIWEDGELTGGLEKLGSLVETLIKSREGDLVILENPEDGIHFRLLTKLVNLIADKVNQGVKVVIETQSDTLISLVLGAFNNGSLGESLVINCFNFDKQGRIKVETETLGGTEGVNLVKLDDTVLKTA